LAAGEATVGMRTAFTEMFGLRHPIALAPMAGVAGGRLAAAVSNGGGLGLVGGGYGDPAWLRAELSLARSGTALPWGVGFITWNATHEAMAIALEHEPHVVMLSFGDPRPFLPSIRAAGCRVICQVQDVEDARAARAAGVDLIVAAGTEAGGHGAARATLPLVPAVVDAVAPTPVLAAGGIVDGRGLAAALVLGAHGALMGTRFYAAEESLGHPNAKERIVRASGGDTDRTRVFDIVRGLPWPEPYTGRALRNPFLERWQGREEALAAEAERERPGFQAALGAGEFDVAMVWAGEGVDLIRRVEPACGLVGRVAAEAESRLAAAAGLLA
jgi:nitronate monooxygenase